MLSTVSKSKRAVAVNIEIMRAFVRLRQFLTSHAKLARKLETLERGHVPVQLEDDSPEDKIHT